MTEQGRAYQNVEGTGFVFNRRRFEGFADHVQMPIQVRVQVARWAVARQVATAWQQWLAELPLEEPARSELQEVAEKEDGFLESEVFRAVLGGMDVLTQGRVLRPEAHLGRSVVWPLSVADVERLFPQISAKQLRDWDTQKLVVAYGWGKGGYRGYFRSQLVTALLVERLLRAGWSVQRIKEEVGLAPKAMEEVAEDLKAVMGERGHQIARVVAKRVRPRQAKRLLPKVVRNLRKEVAKIQGRASQPAGQ